EALPLRSQGALQLSEPHAGLNPAGQVGGLVLQHSAHRLGREGDRVLARRLPQSHLRATAPNDYRGRGEVAQPEPTRRIFGIGGPHDLGRQRPIHAELALLLDANLVAGQNRRSRLYTHSSSPAPTGAARCLGKRATSRVADASRPSPGKTFPGFIRPWGSNTWRIRSMISRSSSEKM